VRLRIPVQLGSLTDRSRSDHRSLTVGRVPEPVARARRILRGPLTLVDEELDVQANAEPNMWFVPGLMANGLALGGG
jgi:hypothetical protein